MRYYFDLSAPSRCNRPLMLSSNLISTTKYQADHRAQPFLSPSAGYFSAIFDPRTPPNPGRYPVQQRSTAPVHAIFFSSVSGSSFTPSAWAVPRWVIHRSPLQTAPTSITSMYTPIKEVRSCTYARQPLRHVMPIQVHPPDTSGNFLRHRCKSQPVK